VELFVDRRDAEVFIAEFEGDDPELGHSSGSSDRAPLVAVAGIYLRSLERNVPAAAYV